MFKKMLLIWLFIFGFIIGSILVPRWVAQGAIAYWASIFLLLGPIFTGAFFFLIGLIFTSENRKVKIISKVLVFLFSPIFFISIFIKYNADIAPVNKAQNLKEYYENIKPSSFEKKDIEEWWKVIWINISAFFLMSPYKRGDYSNNYGSVYGDIPPDIHIEWSECSADDSIAEIKKTASWYLYSWSFVVNDQICGSYFPWSWSFSWYLSYDNVHSPCFRGWSPCLHNYIIPGTNFEVKLGYINPSDDPEVQKRLRMKNERLRMENERLRMENDVQVLSITPRKNKPGIIDIQCSLTKIVYTRTTEYFEKRYQSDWLKLCKDIDVQNMQMMLNK